MRDWVAFAREYLQPMEIGQRIFVVPEWRDDATPPGRIRIEVNAGLAFGTGAHETTRLCLEAIERHLRPGMTVADVGTGSGILSEAAIKLGAGAAYACDTDHGAVIVARENFARAGVAVPVFVGSADSIASAVSRYCGGKYQPCMDSRTGAGMGAHSEVRRSGDSERLRGGGCRGCVERDHQGWRTSGWRIR